MKETRVQKWKTYRDSLIKQEAQIEESKNEIRDIEVKSNSSSRTSTISATSTLPMAEVIKGINEEPAVEDKKQFNMNLIILIIAILIVLAVITGLVFLGIWAFGGQ